MSKEHDDNIEAWEAGMDADIRERNLEAIKRAEQMLDGKLCQCPTCIHIAVRDGNFAIEDTNPNSPFRYTARVDNHGRLRLIRTYQKRE